MTRKVAGFPVSRRRHSGKPAAKDVLLVSRRNYLILVLIARRWKKTRVYIVSNPNDRLSPAQPSIQSRSRSLYTICMPRILIPPSSRILTYCCSRKRNRATVALEIQRLYTSRWCSVLFCFNSSVEILDELLRSKRVELTEAFETREEVLRMGSRGMFHEV